MLFIVRYLVILVSVIITSLSATSRFDYSLDDPIEAVIARSGLEPLVREFGSDTLDFHMIPEDREVWLLQRFAGYVSKTFEEEYRKHVESPAIERQRYLHGALHWGCFATALYSQQGENTLIGLSNLLDLNPALSEDKPLFATVATYYQNLTYKPGKKEGEHYLVDLKRNLYFPPEEGFWSWVKRITTPPPEERVAKRLAEWKAFRDLIAASASRRASDGTLSATSTNAGDRGGSDTDSAVSGRGSDDEEGTKETAPLLGGHLKKD